MNFLTVPRKSAFHRHNQLVIEETKKKNPQNSDTQNIAVIIFLNMNKVVYHSVMYVKVADEMANCRTWSDCSFRTFRSSLIWVYIVYPDMSVRNLTINTVLYGNGQQILRAMPSKLNSRDFGRFPIPTLPKITSLDCIYEVWKYMYICRLNRNATLSQAFEKIIMY